MAHSNVLMSERKVEWGASVHHCGGKVTAASHKASPVVTLSRIINGAEAEQELMRQSCRQQLPQMQPLQYEITVQSSLQFNPPSGFQQPGERVDMPFGSLVPAGLKSACRRHPEGKRDWAAFISRFS